MLMKRLDKSKASMRMDERWKWGHSLLRFGRLLIAVGVLALASNAPAAVVSFETSEGFSGTDGSSFDGATSTPAGVVDKWTVLPGPLVQRLDIDKGPGGAGFGDEPPPISGTQIALAGSNGSGTNNIVEMDLANGAGLSMQSFYYANRGGFPPTLKLDYYATNDTTLLGSDTFTGPWVGGVGIGLGFGFEPKFQLLSVSALYNTTAMGKVVMTSSPGNPASHGSFSMDDITLNVIPEPSSFVLMGLGGIVAIVLRRWKR